MKRSFAVLLALLLVLGVFGCTKQEQQQQPTQQPTQQPGPDVPTATDAPERAEEWDYTVQVERTEQEYTAEDGTVIAKESVERPVLALVNAGGEAYADTEPGRGVTAQQLAVCQTFNDASATLGVWDIDIEEEGRTIYEMRKESGDEMPPVGREITVSEIYRNGSLLSVLEGDYAYLGGAHPDYGLRAWNYDLGGGRFFDLMDLTDRPAELRETIAYEVAAQIAASFFSRANSSQLDFTFSLLSRFSTPSRPPGRNTIST